MGSLCCSFCYSWEALLMEYLVIVPNDSAVEPIHFWTMMSIDFSISKDHRQRFMKWPKVMNEN